MLVSLMSEISWVQSIIAKVTLARWSMLVVSTEGLSKVAYTGELHVIDL